jgi:cobaltochelatase CobS
MDIHTQLSHAAISVVPHRANRETKSFSVRDTFKIDTGVKMSQGESVKDSKGNTVYLDIAVTGFATPGVLTPSLNPNYVFPKEELVQLLQAITSRDTTYLVGQSGTGKTALVNQVAARLNYNVVQINFDGHLSRSDLLGDWKIANGNMLFRYGLVPLAFTEPGTIVLFDEIDACPPETAFVLQRAVSEDLRFLMHETNQIFELHPQNCIVGTANTTGMGDDSGLYVAGTNVQNFSFLNRWKTVIAIDYISPASEVKVLESMFPAVHVQPFISPVVKVLSAVREAFKAGTVSVPLTTRDGINWLEKLTRVPFPMKSARYSFLDKLPPSDALAVANLIQRHFKLPEKDDKKYLLGSKRT